MKSITLEMLRRNVMGQNWKPQPHKTREEDYLYADLEKYADQARNILNESEKAKDSLEKKLIKYNGLNRIMKTILDENGFYLFCFDVTPGSIFAKTYNDNGFDYRDYWNIETIIDLIFQVKQTGNNKFWPKKTSLKSNQSAVALYLLWLQLEKEVERTREQLELIEHSPSTPIASLEDIIDDCAAWEKEQQQQTPHFNVDLPDEVLAAILIMLKEAEWTNNRQKDIGIVGEDIKQSEWLSAFKGPAKDRPALTRKLPVKAEYVVKVLVDQLGDGKYDIGEKLFCYIDKKGELQPVHDLKNKNTYKRKDICDNKTGLIAKIIRDAKSLMDNKDQNSTAVQ